MELTAAVGGKLIILFNRYFCHITFIKWSQICTRTTRKYFSEDIFSVGSFPIEIPMITFKTYTHRIRGCS